MNKIISKWIIMLFSIVIFINCEDKIENPDLTEEYPRIFGPWPGIKDNGEAGSFSIKQDSTLTISLQFTPSHLCVGKWFVDGVEVYEGKDFVYTSTATIKKVPIRLEVTTPKYATSRDAYIEVVE